jgi:hypothetical protein
MYVNELIHLVGTIQVSDMFQTNKLEENIFLQNGESFALNQVDPIIFFNFDKFVRIFFP